MADLEQQLKEDRALRDSARAVFRKELAHVRRESRPGAIGERIANRIGAKADAASDEAIGFAQSHRTTLAVVLAGLAAGAGLWFARKPVATRLRAWFGRDAGGGEDSEDDLT